MIIKNVTREILEHALAQVNARFNGNIEWKRIDRRPGRTRDGGEVWNVTLKARAKRDRFGSARATLYRLANATTPELHAEVLARHGGRKAWIEKHANAGVRLTLPDPWNREEYSQHHIAAACWHAHGVFFDSLPRYVHTNDAIGEGETGKPCTADACADRAKVQIRSGAWTFAPGDPWNDRNVRSDMYPVYFSELCDCGDAFEERETATDGGTGYMHLIG